MWAAVVVIAVVLLAGCSGSSAPRSGATGPTPTLAAATRVLADYAAAVRSRNMTALGAALDPAESSARFRAAQRTDLTNLTNVPLAQWSYSVAGPIADPTIVRAARDRYGAPVLLLQVELDYRLRDIDTVASGQGENLVFTARNGHVYLAGDDALAAGGMNSWDGPWHYGPLAVARGARSLVLGPASAPLAALAEQTDAAAHAVTAVWGAGWSQRVAVIVPATGAEFTALTGAGIRDVSAAAVTESIDPVTGLPAGQRLVLNPTMLGRLTALGRGIVLRHEITHLASAADTADITPRWLVEGLAEYVANLGTGQSVRRAAVELGTQVRAGRMPAALPADPAFASSPASVYEQAWLACRLIAARVGTAGLLRFYRSVGSALEPRSPAVAQAFAHVLGESQARFTHQWWAYLRAQLS